MTAPPVLSVSQVEDFDPEQFGGCPRRWYFERVEGHRPESTTAHEDGHAGHALFKLYLTGGVLPKRARMLKAVQGAIAAGRLPRPGPHLQVEQRFSGQPHRDESGAWVPLDARQTLWHAGHPWEGFIDLRFRHWDGAVTVWDHKFSSDIHARALPADRLLRTVQMPVYALDTLRHWPDATAVNLVHLYVSRRGVESFIRHQRVSVEQVRERAEEVSGLVHQMDAVRGAAAQDDVPFNRAACFARAGCPHQFRCNAFKRRGTAMDLNDEERRMFGLLSEEKPKPVPAEVVRFAERAVDAAQSSGGDLNLDDIFEPIPPPRASAPKPQPAPTCEACGEVLTPENSSRLKTGDMKHIGCPVEAAKLSPRVEVETSGPRCLACRHGAHAGKPCEAKRGRGRCQCGAVMEQPQRPPVPPAPKPKLSADELQAMADEAARAADVDGDGAAVAEAQELRRAADEARTEESLPLARSVATLPFSQAAQDDAAAPLTRAPTGSWSGALAVSVTVELGPSTLAFLAGLVKR